MATPTQIRRRGRFGLILGTIVAALMMVAVAYADESKINDDDVVLEGTTKVVSVTAGSSVSPRFKIDQEPASQEGSGGQNGCNASDGTSAFLSFSGLPAGTTYSPNPFSISNCTGFHAVEFSVPSGTTAGDYPITVSVSDTGGGVYKTANAAFTLRVSSGGGSTNHVPTISSVANNGPVNEGSSATITVTASDQDNDTLSYEFDCNNDGSYDVGPQSSNTASCSFADGPATATVGVRVSDGNGGSATGSTNVIVNNVKPTPAIDSISGNSGAACVAGNTVTLGFSWTDPAGTNDTYNYVVAWGDGSSTPASGTTAVTSAVSGLQHPYSAGGPYTITVTVNDEDPGSGGTASPAAFSFLYTTSGILQPINLTGPRSAFKLGSTIPVKLRVLDCDNATPVGGLTSLTVSLQKVNVGGDPDGIDLEPTSTASPTSGTTMRWDVDAGQYIYNLATKGLALSDYQVKVSSAVIAPQTAIIALKK
jgi:hypothetical protein